MTSGLHSPSAAPSAHAARGVPRRPPLSPALLDALQTRFGTRVTTADAVREHHGSDESPYDPVPPEAVVFAHSTKEVSDIVTLCAHHGTPLIPYGAGSSIEGQLLAIEGGISIDLSEMNAIVSVHAEDLTATVQAGVTRKGLNEHLRDTGLFFPIDPGADASLGGMASTRASGTNAVRYGSMRENVLDLTVVLADGRVIKTGTRARKSSAGYDLTRLFVGSEGTLGIITEVTVRLYPQPEHLSVAICTFPTMNEAVRTVIETIQIGVPISRVEFIDPLAIRALNDYSKLSMTEAPTLFFEFQGSQSAIDEQIAAVRELADGHGASDFQWATRPEERNKLWTARHNALFAFLQLRPGCKAITTDVCVPISRLADCVNETAADLAESGLLCPIVGHVGDGNFHVLILVDPNTEGEFEKGEALNQRLVRRAIAMDGTCTGEHGIGLHKMGFLVEEHGEDVIGVMRAIKQALDPKNLMNPGKIFAFEGPTVPALSV
ncbi:2-hydroxy-acid oxidase [Robbsia andropogonis]|uniref:D-lactate dehydrogenase (cytochrome) n=1 Tax=Robbsia andropogonis TaxID=28092 RepID=A0A0F5JYW6_9BURK|nr:FAD-linked oxidase C-terminal domain-containing protein [Robbsia andropogonis]KKB63061.1 2-hydroxy-acid oxidase [Robbsia andropogonis]MCP1118375.1 FAD-binding protein [Robbsia andropogonis]MCP1127846.1 FAD-binding protein [Robbsia andropogonis]